MLKEIFELFFGWLTYWKYYYLDEKGPERDEKIVEMTGTLIPSNLFFGTLVGLLYGLSLGFYPVIPPSWPMGFILVLFYTAWVFHFFYQQTVHWREVKKIMEIRSFREEFQNFKDGISLIGAVSLDLLSDAASSFEDILEEFFFGHKNEKSHQDTYSSHQEHQDDYRDEEDRVAHILMKYDLEPDSHTDVIKKHFRSLAKKYHPDMPTGDEKRFIELREDLTFLTTYTKAKASS